MFDAPPAENVGRQGIRLRRTTYLSSSYIKRIVVHKPTPAKAVSFGVARIGRAQPHDAGLSPYFLHYATSISGGQTGPSQIPATTSFCDSHGTLAHKPRRPGSSAPQAGIGHPFDSLPGTSYLFCNPRRWNEFLEHGRPEYPCDSITTMSENNQETNSDPSEFDFSRFPSDTLFHERRTGQDRRDKKRPAGGPRSHRQARPAPSGEPRRTAAGASIRQPSTSSIPTMKWSS